jgi:tRNA-2-methylthio-N6-dimethylallyladenosine synthase
MKRGYTVEDYRDMLARIHKTIPEAAVSSDFIVGFSGETDEDFQQTVQLIEACRFKNSFIFKYSERPSTKGAEHLPDDVPNEIKRQRNNELLKIQNAISQEDNEQLLGHTVDVLVEGPSKAARKAPNDQLLVQMTGRTHCDRIVVFDGNRRQAGQIMPITIHDASSHTLFGSVVTTQEVSTEVYSLR